MTRIIRIELCDECPYAAGSRSCRASQWCDEGGILPEPAITIDIYDSPKTRRSRAIGGWREMTIPEDYAEDLAELTAGPWRPGPQPVWDRE